MSHVFPQELEILAAPHHPVCAPSYSASGRRAPVWEMGPDPQGWDQGWARERRGSGNPGGVWRASSGSQMRINYRLSDLGIKRDEASESLPNPVLRPPMTLHLTLWLGSSQPHRPPISFFRQARPNLAVPRRSSLSRQLEIRLLWEAFPHPQANRSLLHSISLFVSLSAPSDD